ncbi:UMP kinase [Candidatus Cryosericum terrychapinii]|jgi:uridylate kinase|uniref:Uridylate kinase n=1 Tax=Candidatus Cryosericum terrychapinii TaxID=2290919 RepID=A0A398D7A0_9BACT|nr:UMP kinase [Candidatus Cryosericum terrychapinii]
MAALYKRVVLKLSGEALKGSAASGIDFSVLQFIAREVQQLLGLGVQVGLVIGGGNIWRGTNAEGTGLDRATADYMGMLATIMNGLALQSAFEQVGLEARAMSALRLDEVCEPYIRQRALEHLRRNRVVIFVGGTGLPYFTTDTVAALRAVEVGADIFLKGTNVDAVYSADPRTDRTAAPYRQIGYDQFLADHLKAMDATAVSLCRENHLPILLFNMNKPGNIVRAAMQGDIGTLIKEA